MTTRPPALFPAPLTAPPSTPARWREWAVALGVVIAAHGLLLAGVPQGLSTGSTVEPPLILPVRVRQVSLLPPPAVLAPEPAMAAAALPPRAVVAPVPTRAARDAPETPAKPSAQDAPAAPPPLDEAPASTLPAPQPPLEALATDTSPAAEPAPEPEPATAADAEGAAPPVYATEMPLPTRLAYDLRRGALSGRAELLWRPEGGRYELTLTGTVLGIEIIGMVSRGAFNAAGLAPERFVDRRRGRDRLAVNFDRTAGRITFSGPAATVPLLPGAQDRLSWMVQLPAIINADPARWAEGSRVSIQVIGARGSADLWTFAVHAHEALDLPGGRVPKLLRLTREPRRPYDTQVEVWLDPARQHLPVRARLTTQPGGDALDLELAE